MDLEAKKKKYPNVPAFALVKDKAPKVNTTNGLTQAIIDYVNANNGYGFRVNSQGTYNEALGKYIFSGSTKGVSDVLACVNGKLICIEVKRSKGDTQREKQKLFQDRIEAAGGKYFIAKSFEGFKNDYNQIIKEI